LFKAGEDAGELEVDQTKAPVLLAIGDIAHVRVVMLHADYQYDGRMIGPAVHILNRTMGAFAGWYAHRARLVDLPRYRPRGGERARPSSQS